MDATPQASNKKAKWRKVLLILFVFSAGFLTHAFVFPEFLANGIIDVQHAVIPNPTPTGTASTSEAFETNITFDGKQFSRHNIAIQIGSYLTIVNISDTKYMWLTSNNPLLATVRNYGKSEQIRQRMDEKGQFVVADKNNPNEKLVITVK